MSLRRPARPGQARSVGAPSGPGRERLSLLFLVRGASSSPAQGLAWLVFLATCLQLTFDWPALHHLTGERARVLGGLMCGLSLLALALLRRKGTPRGSRAEVLIGLVLAGLGTAGALASPAPQTSLLRTAILLLSGLGGFWCARFLLADPLHRQAFINLGLALLGGFLVFKLAQHLAAWPKGLAPSTKHSTAGLIEVLVFAPLALLLGSSPGKRLLSWGLMVLGWLLSLLMLLKTAILMPLLLVCAAVAQRYLRPALLLVPAAALVILVLILPHFYSQHRKTQDLESIYYRAELYSFSWFIAARNPFLGNGLLAPRQEYLADYQVSLEPMGHGLFDKYTNKINVSENIVLTFMADLGLPFTLLYLFSVAMILKRALSLGPGRAPEPFHPLALTLPLIAWAVHSMAFDSLLHPQICWFAHILLGLVGRPGDAGSGAEAALPGAPNTTGRQA